MSTAYPKKTEEQKEKARRNSANYRKRHPGKGAEYTLKYHREVLQPKLYGITEDDYQRMSEAQGGACAICHEPETARDSRTGKVKRLSVDHDHRTGVVRGLLCFKHNIAIGYMDDDPSIARLIAKYLEKDS